MGTRGKLAAEGEAARKRAAIEIVARFEPTLRRTARRYSLCADDAEDAYQRALEILLTKAPTTDARELIRWTQTVTKHEALALRRSREQLLGRVARRAESKGEAVDWVALVPAEGDGPDERAERGETIARSREALKALKPAELRTLSLLAGGCSYAEIGEITGFSPSKVNRSIAEGRERFRHLLSRSEDGSRCGELRPLLSAFCDGETSPEEAAVMREHLRACAHCRSAMRSYRATPREVAALAPGLLAAQPLLERAREILADLHSRLPGRGGADSGIAQVAASGGTKGAGMAALAKVAVVCAGAAGGAAACVAAGIVPAPFGLGADQARQPAIERGAARSADASASGAAAHEPAPQPRPPSQPKPEDRKPASEAAQDAAQAGAVEYTPPPEAAAPAPAPAPPPEAAPPGSSSGGAAGEFGP